MPFLKQPEKMSIDVLDQAESDEIVERTRRARREKLESITWRENRFNYTAVVTTTHGFYFLDFIELVDDTAIAEHFRNHRERWQPVHMRPELDRWLMEEA